MRPAVLCVALSACTALNPAFDPAASQTASAGETTAPTTSPGESTATGPADPTSTTSTSTTTGGPPDPGDSSGTTAGDTPAATTDASTTTNTTGPACALQDAACSVDQPCCGECATCSAGVCVLDDTLCGICGVCIAGSCAPAKQNTPCVPDQEDCDNRIWGLQDGVCYATEPAGACDKDGACIPDCQAKGAVIQTCDPRCLIDPQACAPGGDPDKITFDTFCHHQNLPAGDCVSACNPEGTVVYSNVCDLSGMCMPVSSTACNAYICTGVPGGCTTSCMSADECAAGHVCTNNECL